jgi:hypothetical protein
VSWTRQHRPKKKRQKRKHLALEGQNEVGIMVASPAGGAGGAGGAARPGVCLLRMHGLVEQLHLPTVLWYAGGINLFIISEIHHLPRLDRYVMRFMHHAHA